MKRYLITGGAGFIGSNFIHYLLKNEEQIKVFNLDVLTYAGNLENLKDIEGDSRYKFIQGNICDRVLLEKMFSEKNIDCVVHFAAESHVDRSIDNPLEFVETNVSGTTNLLQVSMKYWKELNESLKESFRFIHISTDEVFGSLLPESPAFTEDTPFSPRSPYAASKAASDLMVKSYIHTHQFPAIISNCSNNYGPYQFPEKLIPLVISNAVNGKTIPVYGDGLQIRDWLYVEDHCAAICEIFALGKPGETYNVGGDNEWANIDLVNKICSILDQLRPESDFFPHADLIQHVSDRPGHDRRYAMNIGKIRERIGWQPRTKLEAGLEKTINWYLENEDWTSSIQERPAYKQWIEKNYTKRRSKK